MLPVARDKMTTKKFFPVGQMSLTTQLDQEEGPILNPNAVGSQVKLNSRYTQQSVDLMGSRHGSNGVIPK